MLTDAQQTALAAAIRASADPTVIAALALRNDVALAEWCNSASTFVVWRPEVPVADYRDAITWTEVDALTTGKARIWEWLTARMTLPINAASAAVRQGIADAFGAGTATRAALLAVSKRFASQVESLFATGTGTDATPGALIYVGPVSLTEVSVALNRNP
jgi:hypothetical protein